MGILQYIIVYDQYHPPFLLPKSSSITMFPMASYGFPMVSLWFQKHSICFCASRKRASLGWYPPNGWFIMEIPSINGWFLGYPHWLRKTSQAAGGLPGGAVERSAGGTHLWRGDTEHGSMGQHMVLSIVGSNVFDVHAQEYVCMYGNVW